jgi:hypothetical protein
MHDRYGICSAIAAVLCPTIPRIPTFFLPLCVPANHSCIALHSIDCRFVFVMNRATKMAV